MNWLERLRLLKKTRMSFSQCGKDLIVDLVLKSLGIHNPSYIDIGAHDPVQINNTYLFYQNGSSGVCVEPDPRLCYQIRKARKRDTCLNVGVGSSRIESADFYVMSSSTLSTFSWGEAERYQGYGKQKIVEVIKIPLVPINDLIGQHFKKDPDLISLDIEGMEMEVLTSFDFSKCRPPIFCIETLTYTEDNSERKIIDIIGYMNQNNYITYADTYINTIFVDGERWRRR